MFTVTLNGGVAAVKGLLYVAKAVPLRSHTPFKDVPDAPLNPFGIKTRSSVPMCGGGRSTDGRFTNRPYGA